MALNWNPFYKKSKDPPAEISVTCTEVASCKILFETEMELSSLPEAFDEGSVLHIGEQEWPVLRATPAALLAKLAASNSLCLVDWCRCISLQADAITGYFASHNSVEE
jgi:hypothetical protein